MFVASPAPISAQAPESPQRHDCTESAGFDDGPKPGWRRFPATALGVTIPYPPAWSIRETERGRRVAFLDRNSAVLQAFIVDQQGRSPDAWVRARVEKMRQCRLIELSGRVAKQCVNTATSASITFLAYANRILAFDASGAVSGETLCGIVMGVENLVRRSSLPLVGGAPLN